MGDASELLTTLSFVVPGMPLIYSGQEYDLDNRLLFFEKDQIPHTKKTMWSLLEKLGQLKNSSPALNGGKNAAVYNKIDQDNSKVLAFKRVKGGQTITFLGNFSSTNEQLKNPSVGAVDYASGKIELSKNITLKPWGFRILVEK